MATYRQQTRLMGLSEGNTQIYTSETGKVRMYGGDLYVHGDDNDSDTTRVHTIGGNSYIDFVDGGEFHLREGATTRIRIYDKNNASSSTGMQFINPNFDNATQDYGYYFNQTSTGNNSANYLLYLRNYSNHYNSRGILMRNGANTIGGSATYFMVLQDGNGTSVAYVTCNSAGTTTWGTFTGAHHAQILESDSPSANIKQTETHSEADESTHPAEYPNGTIVSTVKSELTEGNDQPKHYIVSSSIFQDKRVLGVYGGSLPSISKNKYIDDGDGNMEISEKAETPHNHQTYSLGDGVVWVCSQNGNIENGDYITTASGSGGYGCKQNDDLLHNYTVAKSNVNVDWSAESESTKLIPCTIHCG